MTAGKQNSITKKSSGAIIEGITEASPKKIPKRNPAKDPRRNEILEVSPKGIQYIILLSRNIEKTP